MIKGKLLRGTLGLVIATFAMHVSAGTSWDINNNSVTYSVLQEGIPLGSTASMGVALNQLNLSELAAQEKVGSAVNYTLTSVVLSIHGTIYGTVYFKNKSADAVTPSFKVSGNSKLYFAETSTAKEYYDSEVSIGTIAASGGTYNNNSVVVEGEGKQSVTIASDLARFLGTGTIATIAKFPVDGYFSSGGTSFDSTVSLQGKADIAVTYYYDYTAVPEPTSMALLSLAGAVLALRRKRVVTA